jgi:hypothetical protein
MAAIDETKERLSYLKNFLTIILGALVITIGGLTNLYLSRKLGLIFWLGLISVVSLALVSWRLMSAIEKHLKRLGKL